MATSEELVIKEIKTFVDKYLAEPAKLSRYIDPLHRDKAELMQYLCKSVRKELLHTSLSGTNVMKSVAFFIDFIILKSQNY